MAETVTEADNKKAEVYLIDAESLREFFQSLSQLPPDDWCAVDTEADSLHSYDSKMCLIQFAAGERRAVIDPLAIDVEGLQPFLDFVENRPVWMHGADYDMAMFVKTFGRIPKTVWDTQTAARLSGAEQFGLATLIEAEFGVTVSKQSQKADWGKRPLSEKMLDYAFNDVRYMLPMARRFYGRLVESGRLEWFLEWCDLARQQVLERDDKPSEDAWRVGGWGKLPRPALVYLKYLWYWRDEECRRLDRPAFKLLGNQQLLQFSEKLAGGERIQAPRHLRHGQARRFFNAIEEASNIPRDQWPALRLKNGNKRLQIDEDAFNKLRQHRNQIADKLGIDPTILASRSVMERLSADEAPKPDELLMKWQRELLFGEEQ